VVLASDPAGCGAQELGANTGKANATTEIASQTWARIVAFVILDLQYPRLGLIRVDAVDQVLVDLRDSMK